MFRADQAWLHLSHNMDPNMPGAKNLHDEGKDRGSVTSVNRRNINEPVVMVRYAHPKRGKQSFRPVDIADFMPEVARAAMDPAEILIQEEEEEENGWYPGR